MESGAILFIIWMCTVNIYYYPSSLHHLMHESQKNVNKRSTMKEDENTWLVYPLPEIDYDWNRTHAECVHIYPTRLHIITPIIQWIYSTTVSFVILRLRYFDLRTIITYCTVYMYSDKNRNCSYIQIFLLSIARQGKNRRRIKTEGKAKVVAVVWGTEFIQSLLHQLLSTRMIWRKGWIELRLYLAKWIFKKMDDHPVHTIPNHHYTKMDVLPKTSVQIILAGKWWVRHSSTSPPK